MRIGKETLRNSKKDRSASRLRKNDSIVKWEGKVGKKADTSGEQVQRYQRIMGNTSNGMMVQILPQSSDLPRAMRAGEEHGKDALKPFPAEMRQVG